MSSDDRQDRRVQSNQVGVPHRGCPSRKGGTFGCIVGTLVGIER